MGRCGGGRERPRIIENTKISVHSHGLGGGVGGAGDARIIESIWNSMQLLDFESVVLGRAGPIDFGDVGICGCGPWLRKCPHNPRTTPLLPMVLNSHVFTNFLVLVRSLIPGYGRCPRLAPESLKMRRVHAFSCFGRCGEGHGRPQNN